MTFWIFKCNRKYYKLSKRLKNPDPATTWIVNQFADGIGRGHTAFIWQTGTDRGIVGSLRIEDDPHDMAEIETEKPYYKTGEPETCRRVNASIIHRCRLLDHETLRSIAGLERLSVFRGNGIDPRGTNFPVTPSEGSILLKLVADAKSG